jgi:hypothetical protein
MPPWRICFASISIRDSPGWEREEIIHGLQKKEEIRVKGVPLFLLPML